MKAKRVTVLDYGVGNLFSVRRALEHCGAEVLFATDPGGIAAAERLVLPGVGAFADGMQGLRERGLPDPVREYAIAGWLNQMRAWAVDEGPMKRQTHSGDRARQRSWSRAVGLTLGAGLGGSAFVGKTTTVLGPVGDIESSAY